MIIADVFQVDVTADKLEARLSLQPLSKEELVKLTLSEKQLKQFIEEKKIVYGINYATLAQIVNDISKINFPITIAEGTAKVDGESGEMKYLFDTTTEVDRTKGWNFKEVARIPTVEVNEKIATIIPPTKGTDGKTVFGTVIKARPGKPVIMRPGKNVTFNNEDQSFYAKSHGQVNVMRNSINVHSVYELNESISMKTGNIDFPGTVIIRGDVPTGFTVKATGDIKVFGLVEAATISAEGNVFVSEGLAGLKSGKIESGGNIHIGYVNQGIILAKDNVFVENSILHSICTATNDIICSRGNIIGGTISVGRTVIAKDIGNRMNTKTQISFGIDQQLHDEQMKLEQERDTLVENINKLNVLKARINSNIEKLDSKSRITALRLTHSLEQSNKKLAEIEKKLKIMNASLGDKTEAYLKVKGTIYPNAIISFGKYKRIIDKEYDYVTITTNKNEITIS